MRTPLSLVLLALAAARTSAQPPTQAPAQTPADPELERAAVAWDRGEYPRALEGLARLLRSPGAEQYLEPVALLTGELYQTTEVAPDGRAVRFSADGRFAAYEVGAGASRTTYVIDIANGARRVAELKGTALAFAPAGDKVAYIRITETDSLTAARADVARGEPPAVRARTIDVMRLELKNGRIVERDLRSNQESELPVVVLKQLALAYGADGKNLYFIGGADGDSTRTDVYSLTQGGSAKALTTDPGFKSDPVVLPGGRHLMHAIGRNPSLPPGPGAGPVAGFGIVDLNSGGIRNFQGAAPSVAADGSAVVYVARSPGANRVIVAALREGASLVTVKETPLRVDNPALSHDGRRVAYQMMLRDDWELFLVNADGSAEQRLTREIQHDLFPRFLTNDRLLAVMGEARHRRSHLYDLATGRRTRLFHNNTVRTIAPEYEWVPNADGSKILIVSERDGNTVSPERGVYLTDLGRKVTVREVLDRITGNVAAERDLRARGEAMYRPIFADVKRLTDSVSITRVYRLQKALSEFDSRYITRPGNQRAGEYLSNAFKSFGYEPALQWFEPPARFTGAPRTANVVATLRGTENPDLVYVIGSHYDSVNDGPGADDNASGTTVLLEAARVLAKHPLPATIVFVAFTGEEAGLLGSREFTRQAQADKLNVVGALNNDMLGWSNDHRLDNTIRYSNPGIRDVQHAGAFLFSKLITYDALYYKSTDAHAMYDAWGDVVGGIGSYPVLGNPNYHQPTDLLETINHELVTETARATVATLALLASSPSRVKGLTVTAGSGGRGAEARWTASPEKGVRSYVVAYGPAEEPMRHRMRVSAPSARITNAPAGTVVAVKAINARGLESWDWARAQVGGGAVSNNR